MRFRWLGAVVLLLAAMLFASNWGGRAQVPVRKTWEYKMVTAQYGPVPATLSEEQLDAIA